MYLVYSVDSGIKPKKYSNELGMNSSMNSIPYSNSTSKWAPNSFSSSMSNLFILLAVGSFTLIKKLKKDFLGASSSMVLISPVSYLWVYY